MSLNTVYWTKETLIFAHPIIMYYFKITVLHYDLSINSNIIVLTLYTNNLLVTNNNKLLLCKIPIKFYDPFAKSKTKMTILLYCIRILFIKL